MQTCKSNATYAQNLGPKRVGGGQRPPPPFLGAAEGRPPSFVHLLHLLRCFYMLFACFAFVLHFIYILFASLLGMMRQLLRQWLLPRMLWMLYNMVSYYTIWYYIIQYGIILYNMVSYYTIWYMSNTEYE